MDSGLEETEIRYKHKIEQQKWACWSTTRSFAMRTGIIMTSEAFEDNLFCCWEYVFNILGHEVKDRKSVESSSQIIASPTDWKIVSEFSLGKASPGLSIKIFPFSVNYFQSPVLIDRADKFQLFLFSSVHTNNSLDFPFTRFIIWRTPLKTPTSINNALNHDRSSSKYFHNLRPQPQAMSQLIMKLQAEYASMLAQLAIVNLETFRSSRSSTRSSSSWRGRKIGVFCGTTWKARQERKNAGAYEDDF